jgi:glycosyltransferase involved in cell wall biosynthesis
MKDAAAQSNVVKEDKDKESFHHYPLVSVGVPTYNGSAKIEKAVKSVLTQGYPNFELIISDNCSTDTTTEICIELAKKNKSIRYFRQSHNIGLMPNFEFVLSQASGDFFMWISDDDSLEPGIMQKYVDFLLENPRYSLVSGQIKYWVNQQPVLCEHDFNFEQNWRVARLVNFYFKVVYGSIFYGLMRKSTAEQIPLKNRIGDDWHFIASVAYLGKIKNLDCIGYHKKCGGLSGNFKKYGKALGAGSFATRFPHAQIAIDGFWNILYDSPVYSRRHYVTRLLLAFTAFLSIIANYYGTQYPFILGGRLKRLMGLKTSQTRYRAA